MTDLPAPLSREARIYRALWLKVAETSETIEVKFQTTSEAISFRMAMYRFIRKYREDPDLDLDLTAAAELVSISSVSKGQTTINILRKQTLDLAEQALLASGIDEKELLSSAERDMLLASEAKELALEIEAPRGNTPFYQRD